MRTIALAIATVGGVGYAPIVPGTFGSLVALPLLVALAALRASSVVGYAIVVAAVIVAAIWAAGRAEDILGGHDQSQIVVDEVAGLVVAGIFLPGTWGAATVAFFLFRIFDVLKPFPANAVDARVRGGLGVVGDDLIAGVYAGLATRAILALF